VPRCKGQILADVLNDTLVTMKTLCAIKLPHLEQAGPPASPLKFLRFRSSQQAPWRQFFDWPCPKPLPCYEHRLSHCPGLVISVGEPLERCGGVRFAGCSSNQSH